MQLLWICVWLSDINIRNVSDIIGLLIFAILRKHDDVRCRKLVRRTTTTAGYSIKSENVGKQIHPNVNGRFTKNCTTCPDIYLPVCTNKSRTYQNTCLFLCKRRKREGVVRRGVCILFRRSFGPKLPRFPTFKRYR